MNVDLAINSREVLDIVISRVSFAPSCVNFNWKFEVQEVVVPGGPLPHTGKTATYVMGWLVNTKFTRPDTHTGEIKEGRGRQELILMNSTESGAVKTLWLLVELIIRHELMEAFLYQGLRPFDPHANINDLCVSSMVNRGTRA